MELYSIFLVLMCLFGSGLALECYVCADQPDNKDKCVKTTVQCEESQDTCLTHIEWRAPDFWTPRSEKMFYVHKACHTSTYCANMQREVGIRCMRDWYRDWECYECCGGDRCNFYVTLGSTSVIPSFILLVASLVAVLISQLR
ncbi:low affinity cationic amino acid transporter 2 [Biomphalaria glabrata]|uniref:Uncharacterized protein LOC106062633 n=1 Tax=Biomphalaria glabrata TaxID=6526 RepID=A0A9W2Z5Q7_BIOGL|nr:uncharacterized protein LOC106062633 [Biomphalaria glabrata]KAI8745270.1 prostate stem cell antigen [Biomphalaria glabrata]